MAQGVTKYLGTLIVPCCGAIHSLVVERSRMMSIREDEAVHVVLVDDHPVVRTGLARIIGSWSRSSGVSEFAHGADLVSRWIPAADHVVAIVDLCMPVMDGYETLQWLKHNKPTVPALALTFDPSVEAVARAMSCGARGILDKVSSEREYHAALNDVVLTGFHYNALVASYLERREQLRAAREANPGLLEKLTDRELEFCDQVCSLDDPSYAVIAERMGISVNTVEVHRRNLFKKFGVRTRQSLFRALQRWKVIRGGDRGATMP